MRDLGNQSTVRECLGKCKRLQLHREVGLLTRGQEHPTRGNHEIRVMENVCLDSSSLFFHRLKGISAAGGQLYFLCTRIKSLLHRFGHKATLDRAHLSFCHRDLVLPSPRLCWRRR